MKLSKALVVGSCLVVVCLLLYLREPPQIRVVANSVYDAMVRLNGVGPQSGAVAIVDIDEDSLAVYGQWPWPRHCVAELTRRLLEAGASVVAFDILFSESDRTSPRVIVRELSALTGTAVRLDGVPAAYEDFDAVFAHALAAGRTVLGCYMHPVPQHLASMVEPMSDAYRGVAQFKGAGLHSDLPQARKLTPPLAVLGEAAASVAFFNTIPDDDTVVRRTPLLFAYGELRIYQSLALEAVRQHTEARQLWIECRPGWFVGGIKGVRMGPRRVPTDRNGQMLVNYRASRFPVFPADELLAGNVDAGAISNRIVFVGSSAATLADLVATPHSPEFPGVEVHATAADNMLTGDVLVEPRWMAYAHMLLIIGLGMALTVLIHRTRAWLSFLITLLLVLLAAAAGVFLLHACRLVFVPAQLILAMLFIYTVLTLLKYRQEERQKRRVREMFGTMVSKSVLTYLEENPGSFSLTGHRAEATVLFADVASFTTIAESLPPEQVSELLNRYLSPMTEIIMNRGGLVDKYNGDAIMAEWGVPYPAPDHAVQGCLAALEQQERLAQLRPVLKEEYGHELHVRMGLCSGEVTAGNMGSDLRFQYTVMGDTVNQASRYEPANKDYGSRIMIGETTYRMAEQAVEARLLDRIIVVGKTQPVTVYELLGRKGEVPAEGREAATRYEEALRLHWERKWDEALERLARIEHGDRAVAFLKARIQAYRQTAPPPDWQGEYVRETKH